MKKNYFSKILKYVIFPDEFSSNISCCVNIKKHKIGSLKSYDSHVLLECHLLFAICGILNNELYDALTGLSYFLKELCLKLLSVDDLDRLK